MNTLKSCPFCGSLNLGYMALSKPLPDFEDDGSRWLIACRKCNMQFITPSMAKEKLVEFWNRRSDND